MGGRKFPLVYGTEQWPCPLLDMPDLPIEVSPAVSVKLDGALDRLRALAKDRDFCINYGIRVIPPKGDSHE